MLSKTKRYRLCAEVAFRATVPIGREREGIYLVERMFSTHVCLAFPEREMATWKTLVLTSNHCYQGYYKNMHKTERVVEMRRECFKNVASGHWNKDDTFSSKCKDKTDLFPATNNAMVLKFAEW